MALHSYGAIYLWPWQEFDNTVKVDDKEVEKEEEEAEEEKSDVQKDPEKLKKLQNKWQKVFIGARYS